MEKNYPKQGFNVELFFEEISAELKSKIISYSFNNGMLTLTTQSLDVNLELELDNRVVEHDHTAFSQYMVLDLITQEFSGYPLENTDFARHLRSEIALNKEPIMNIDGRPISSDYYYDFGGNVGVKMVAQILFVFDKNDDNLVTRRREYIKYYRYDGTSNHPEILKNDLKINPMNLAHGSWIIGERISGRKNIVKEMNYFLLGVIKQATGKPTSEILLVVEQFFQDFKDQIQKFERYGMENWKQDMMNMDTSIYTVEINGQDVAWMSFPVDENETTVHQYMLYRLSY